MSASEKRLNRYKTNRYGYIFAATSLFALVATGTTNGQTVAAPPANPTQNLEEIVITGTQIRGVAPVGSSVIAVGHEEILQSGLNNTSDIIHDIPQVSGLGAGQNTIGSNQAANININKANAINIRGLGDQATLTLVDGRRVAPGGPSAELFDPSSIPTIALRSIDVVADGASATYGSDAVAGVANLVLRTNFEGAEVDAHYGSADSYQTRKIDAIFGHKWSTGSLMVAGEINNNSQLTQGQRLQYFNCNETAFGGANSCVKYGIPGNITVPAGASVPAGVYGLPAGNGVGVTAAQLSPNINYFNAAQDTTLIPKSERKSLVANVQQFLNDDIKIWAEGYFSQNNIAFFNGQFQATAAIKNTNPGFIPLGAATSESITLGLDPYAGSVIRSGYERGYQASGGVDVDLTDAIQFNGYYEHLGNDLINNFGAINQTALATALACTTPGLCFNPVGTAAGNQSAANTFIGSQTYTDHFASDLVNAKIDGTVFTLPGGDVKLAIGTEIHHDSFQTYNIGNTVAPTLATTSVTTNTGASRDVYSVYAEAIVPIVGADNALPFVERLQIDLAGRYDDYSDVGSTLNPKYGFTWKPVEDLTIHGSYGTSFRAPTLCDNNPSCSAAVLSAPAYGPGNNVLTIVGGNSALKPETATTYSVGGDYKPSWLSGASFSLNYFNINYQNVIGTPAATNPAVFTQAALYAPFVILHPTAAQIAAVTSLPFYTASAPFPVIPGSVTAIVNGTRQNAGAVLTDGLDIAASYDWTSGWGDWTVGATASYIMNYNYELLAGSGFVNRLNQANYPVSFRARAKFGWSNEDFGAIAYVNYTGGYNVVQLVTLANGTLQNQPVNSYTTVDTTFLYKLNTPSWGGGYANNITVTLAIQNLLDAKAPFAMLSTTAQFDSQNASALGRLITVGIRKSF